MNTALDLSLSGSLPFYITEYWIFKPLTLRENQFSSSPVFFLLSWLTLSVFQNLKHDSRVELTPSKSLI